MRPNVLITSAGRRGKLVAAFQQELARLLPQAKVFAADACPELSVGCRLADASFVAPPVSDPDHIPCLHRLCGSYDVGLVVPTIDPELSMLARASQQFERQGTVIAVSHADFVDTCRDKRKLTWWFSQQGLRTPQLLDANSLDQFPVFVKPYDGSGSCGARVVESLDDISGDMRRNERLMYLEYLSPHEHDEFTIDMYYDCRGELRCLVPRQRLETRAGEVSKSKTRRIPVLQELSNKLGRLDGVRGCITLQMLVNRQTEAAFAIEINPRFGGGFPLSYEAGANYPGWLIREYLLSQPIEFYDEWEDDLTMLRYDDHVLVRDTAPRAIGRSI